MDVFLAFNHMFVLGTRGLGLIKQLWLAKFLSVITNHRRLPYLRQTCWSPPKKYRRIVSQAAIQAPAAIYSASGVGCLRIRPVEALRSAV